MTNPTHPPIARFFFRRSLALLLLVTLLSGCTAQARRARHLDRAENYFKSGEYEKAKIEYLNVLRSDSQNATSYIRMGAIWWEQGAPLRAGPFLLRGRELSPKDADNRLKLARVFLSVGALADARREAAAVLEQSPGNGEAIELLAEGSRTSDDIAALGAQLQKFPDRDSILFHVASANFALRRGDIAGGEGHLRRALDIDPKSPAAHTGLATLYLFQKNMEKAGEELKLASNLAPVRSLERMQYAEFRTHTGGTEEATALLRETTTKAPDFLPAWRLLAQIAFGQQKYDDALSLVEHVLQQDPDNADGRMIEAQVRIAKGEGAKAVDGLERLEKAYPTVPVIKFQLARAYLLNNDPKQAVASLNQIVTRYPDFLDPIMMLAEINLRSGDMQTVVNSMSEVLKKQPRLTQAQVYLAEAYRGLGRIDEAVAVFRQQIQENPQSAPPYVALGLLLRQQKKDDEARAAFAKGLELAPENTIAADQLADMDIASQDFEGALRRLEEQIAKNPQLGSLYVTKGKVHTAQKQWDEAEAAFLKALELDPNTASAYDLLIATYIATNKLPQAAAQLEAILVKNGGNPATSMVLGLIYERMEQYEKARDAYEKVLSVRPDFVTALNNLAYLYSQRFSQLDRASELARKAHTLQPGNPAVTDTLGWIVFKQNDYQQALALLQESAAKLPNSAEAQYHFGMANYMMGQLETANVALRKAAESEGDFPGKDEAQHRLALLGDSSGKQELSVAELEALLKQQPNDPVALLRLGDAFTKENNVSKAANAYEQALKINPKLLRATIRLAEFNLGPLNNKEKSQDYAKKARELAPTDPQVAKLAGNVAYQTGNFTRAYSLLQESSRQLPDDAGLQHDYAWAAYSLGKTAEAQQAMEKVASLAPNTSDAEDAQRFLALVRLPEASSAPGVDEPGVEEALRADANYVPALIIRASTQRQRGELKAAEDTCGRILQRFPDFAPAQRELAGVLAVDPANAARAYDLAMKARKTLTEDPELGRILGVVSYQRKEYAQAIQILQQTARKQPLDAESLYYLGMAHLAAKQRPQGVEALNRALAGGLKGAHAEEAAKLVVEPPVKKAP